MSFETMLDQLKGDVREFRIAFQQEIDPTRQTNLVIEEGNELLEAAENLRETRGVDDMEKFLKEVADLMYVVTGSIEQAHEFGVEAYQSAVDRDVSLHAALLVQTCSYLLEGASALFLDDDMIIEAFKRVHFSNMSKLDDDGNPIRREDGKVLKGPNYVAPDLSDLAQAAIDRWATATQNEELADAE